MLDLNSFLLWVARQLPHNFTCRQLALSIVPFQGKEVKTPFMHPEFYDLRGLGLESVSLPTPQVGNVHQYWSGLAQFDDDLCLGFCAFGVVSWYASACTDVLGEVWIAFHNHCKSAQIGMLVCFLKLDLALNRSCSLLTFSRTQIIYYSHENLPCHRELKSPRGLLPDRIMSSLLHCIALKWWISFIITTGFQRCTYGCTWTFQAKFLLNCT